MNRQGLEQSLDVSGIKDQSINLCIFVFLKEQYFPYLFIKKFAPYGSDILRRYQIQNANGYPIKLQRLDTGSRLRMLLNNLDPEVAERPDDLIVYGGRGKAARNFEALDQIIASLKILENDESLLIQSGKPVGILKTHKDAPRVLISNSQLVPNWANWKHFDELEKKGLMMYGQMTAGSWIYIGSQGIVQGTYETYAAAANKHFNGTLKGTLNVTAGLGGMGGAQPLAITMNEGVALIAEVELWRIEKRIETKYL